MKSSTMTTDFFKPRYAKALLNAAKKGKKKITPKNEITNRNVLCGGRNSPLPTIDKSELTASILPTRSILLPYIDHIDTLE